MKNVISQSLGLDFVNINAYAKVYQNIPLSSRGRAILLFQNLNLGNASANPKWHLTIFWATSCQYQCEILSKYSKQFKSYRHFSWTGRRQNLHKLSDDKIKMFDYRALYEIQLSADFLRVVQSWRAVKPKEKYNFLLIQENMSLRTTKQNKTCRRTMQLAWNCAFPFWSIVESYFCVFHANPSKALQKLTK